MFSSFLDTSRELGGEVECLVMKPGSRLTSVPESNPCIQKGLLQIRLRICLKHLWPSPTHLQRGKLREKNPMWQDGLERVIPHSRCNEDILYICTHTHIYTYILCVCVCYVMSLQQADSLNRKQYYLLKILKHKSRNCLPVFLFYFLFRFSLFHTHTRLNIFIY